MTGIPSQITYTVTYKATRKAGVPADKAGLAAALLNSSQQVGGALGLAIFSAVATSRTTHLLGQHAAVPRALTAGFHQALLTGSAFLLAATFIGLRNPNAHGEAEHPVQLPLTELT